MINKNNTRILFKIDKATLENLKTNITNSNFRSTSQYVETLVKLDMQTKEILNKSNEDIKAINNNYSHMLADKLIGEEK